MSLFGWIWLAILAIGILLVAGGVLLERSGSYDVRIAAWIPQFWGMLVLLGNLLLLIGRIVWKALT